MKKNGLKQIAQRAGVSHSTVSRVLNNRPGISREVRNRILRLAEVMGYTRSLKRQAVAVIMRREGGHNDLYSSLLLFSLTEELKKQSIPALYVYADDIGILAETFIGGALSLDVFGRIARKWNAMRSAPLICINDYNSALNNIPSVCSDESTGITDAVRHLVLRRHKLIALFSAWEQTLSTQLRTNAFFQAAANAGVEGIHVQVFPRKPQSIDEALAGLPADCHAVICAVEELYPEMCSRFSSCPAPMDLVLWKFPNASEAAPPDTLLVSQNYEALASAAVDMLQQMVKGGRVESRIVPYCQNIRSDPELPGTAATCKPFQR